jgi:hypothetical protein
MEPYIRKMPDSFGGQGSEYVTNLHPISIFIVVILGLAMIFLPRRWALIPLLVVACFIPMSQRVVVLGLNFNILRIMVVFGWIRLFFKEEFTYFRWLLLDKVLILWVISGSIIYIVQQGTFSAFVYRLGVSFDAFGLYFLLRCLIREKKDVYSIILGLVWISIPISAFFLLEYRTGRNFFSLFGKIPEVASFRDGQVRAMGPFGCPILAGCFWAGLLPFFISYGWKDSRSKPWAIIGVFCALTIVITCSSSTPVLGVMAGLVGAFLFFLRKQMKIVRWSVLFTLIVLHLIMKAPVWHLICRVSAVGGSTGYFRYQLIDSAIRHFNEWALLGTRSTAHWFFGAQDVCNHFILEGVRGGALTLILFIAFIALAFQGAGLLCKTYEKDRSFLILSWALGVSIFIHCMQFIGVSYIGGAILIVWYLPIAIIGSLNQKILSTIRI